jgi:hypothetical protein
MALRGPFTVIVRISKGASLGETMKRLRLWLDGEKIQIAQFETAVDAGGLRLSMGFRTIQDADRFRAQFGSPAAEAEQDFTQAVLAQGDG